MRIGILGAGRVAKALACGFAASGHQVLVGCRKPDDLTEVGSGNTAVSCADIGQCVALSEVLFVAVPWDCALRLFKGVGNHIIRDKIIVDVTNPICASPNGCRLAVSYPESVGQLLQEAAPSAHVVKAMNTSWAADMVNPSFEGGPPDMPICGNNAAAKRVVSDLCGQLGWGVVDVGDIESAPLLESLSLFLIKCNHDGKRGLKILAPCRRDPSRVSALAAGEGYKW